MSVSTSRVPLRPADVPAVRARYVDGMARMTAGVAIVTTDGPAGRFGQTVTAVTSVCADPPVLLVCLYRDTPVAAAVAVNRCLAVNVLAADQRALADDFAGRTGLDSRYRFDDGWRARRTGSPTRADAAAVFDCELRDATIVGTHVVVYAQVVAAESGDRADLTYRGRDYGVHQPFVTRSQA